MYKTSSKFFNENLEKKPNTPFINEGMPLDDECNQFYFTAPAIANGAYAIVKSKGKEKKVKSIDLQDLIDALNREGAEVEVDYFVEGIASSCNTDLEEEKIAPGCIEYMKENVIASDIPLRNAHSSEWDSVLGKLVEIEIEGEGEDSMLFTKFKLNNFDEDPFAKKLWNLLKNGEVIGLSIGGIVSEYSYETNKDSFWDTKIYNKIELKEVSVTKNPANTDTFLQAVSKSLNKSLDIIEKAKWDTAFINNLPDAAFAYIEPGGEKDEDGKTKPRSLRHLPHHNSNVKSSTENSSVDKPHLRNALARLSQTNISEAAKKTALSHLNKHAQALGIGTDKTKSQEEINVKTYTKENIDKTLSNDNNMILKELNITSGTSLNDIIYDIINIGESDKELLNKYLQSINFFTMKKSEKIQDDILKNEEVTEETTEVEDTDEVEVEETDTTEEETTEEVTEETEEVDEEDTEEETTETTEEVDKEVEDDAMKSFKKLLPSLIEKAVSDAVTPLKNEIKELKSKSPVYKKVEDCVEINKNSKNEKTESLTISGAELNKYVRTPKKWFEVEKQYTAKEANDIMVSFDPYASHKNTRFEISGLYV